MYIPSPSPNVGTLLASAAQTATVLSSLQSKPENRVGVLLIVNVTAASGTTPTLTPHIQTIDPATGNAIDLAVATAAITGVGTYTYVLYPNASGGAPTQSISQPLPESWQVNFVIAGTTPSFTFSASYVYLV